MLKPFNIRRRADTEIIHYSSALATSFFITKIRLMNDEY